LQVRAVESEYDLYASEYAQLHTRPPRGRPRAGSSGGIMADIGDDDAAAAAAAERFDPDPPP